MNRKCQCIGKNRKLQRTWQKCAILYYLHIFEKFECTPHFLWYENVHHKKICLNGSSICWIFFLVAVLYFTCNRTSNMCCEHVFFIPILSTEPPSSPCYACMVWGRCAAIQFTNALAFVFISKKPSYRVSMGMLSGWRRTNGSSATKCLRSSSIASTLAMCLSLCVWMMLKNVCIIHWIVVCCAIQASLTILSSQFSPHFIFCTQSHVVYDCFSEMNDIDLICLMVFRIYFLSLSLSFARLCFESAHLVITQIALYCKGVWDKMISSSLDALFDCTLLALHADSAYWGRTSEPGVVISIPLCAHHECAICSIWFNNMD